MSDSPGSQREWRFYLQDMIGFAEKCLSYTDAMNQQQFVDSGITYDAMQRCATWN